MGVTETLELDKTNIRHGNTKQQIGLIPLNPSGIHYSQHFLNQ